MQLNGELQAEHPAKPGRASTTAPHDAPCRGRATDTIFKTVILGHHEFHSKTNLINFLGTLLVTKLTNDSIF